MRKLIYTLSFLTFTTLYTFAQAEATTKDGKTVLLKDDGTWEYVETEEKTINIPALGDKTFVWRDGRDEYVDVKFEYYIEIDLSIEVIQKVVIKTMSDSKYSLKNKYSFVPKSLTLMKTSSGYSAITEYVGANAYGSESLHKTYFSFDESGEVVKLMTR